MTRFLLVLLGLLAVLPVMPKAQAGTSSAVGRTAARPALPRIAPLAEAEWTDANRALATTRWPDGNVPNYFKTFLNHPKLVDGMMPFEHYVVHESALPARHVELLMLRTAWLCRSDYLWARRAKGAEQAGVSRDDLRRIAQGPDANGWDAFEAALLRSADELHVDAAVSDKTWRTLAEHYDTRHLMDAVFIVGGATMLADMFNSLGIQPDVDATNHLPVGIAYRVPTSRHEGPLRKARILPMEPSVLTPALLKMLDPSGSGREVAAVYRTYAQDPELYPSRQLLSEYIRAHATLTPRIREMLILRIGVRSETEYEWSPHVRAGRRAGLTDADIHRIYFGADGHESPIDGAVLQAVDEIYGEDVISDMTWKNLAANLDAKQLLDLLVTTAGYRMFCMAMNTFGVQLEPGGERFPTPAR